MAQSKRKRIKSSRRTVTLARPRTEAVEVVVPTLEGKAAASTTQTVERVIDLLTQMYNRKDISQVQFAAGDRYRTAFEMTSGSAGGAGDFNRVRGNGGPGSITEVYVEAARFVSDAKWKILYPRDYAVLHRVCVEGKTLDRAAQELSAGDSGLKLDRQLVGYMFKSALSQLAAAWWPHKVPKIDQSTLDYLAGDKHADDKPQFVVMGTPEWARVDHYRMLKGLQPLVPQKHTRDGVELIGAWLKAEGFPMTSMSTEKSSVIATDDFTASSVVHATRDKVFWSKNRDIG